MSKGWIGVDLDGVLAHYEHWVAADVIGEPIVPMVDRVKAWLAEGREVRIFTARVWHDGSPTRMEEAREASVAIMGWCEKNIGAVLPVTCIKDFSMIVLYDDRCVQVETNTGRLIEDAPVTGPTMAEERT